MTRWWSIRASTCLHGQVVVDGIVEIHSGVAIAPFVTIGLRAGDVARRDDRART